MIRIFTCWFLTVILFFGNVGVALYTHVCEEEGSFTTFFVPDNSHCEKKLSETEITVKLESFLTSNDSELNSKNSHSHKSTLSKREQQILQLLLQGKTTQNIATELGIKSNTVSTLKNRIFEKLQVNNLVDLMQLYN